MCSSGVFRAGKNDDSVYTERMAPTLYYELRIYLGSRRLRHDHASIATTYSVVNKMTHMVIKQ